MCEAPKGGQSGWGMRGRGELPDEEEGETLGERPTIARASENGSSTFSNPTGKGRPKKLVQKGKLGAKGTVGIITLREATQCSDQEHRLGGTACNESW